MKINLSNTIKDIYFVGDVHGSWDIVTYYIRHYKIHDSVFIFCGDVGIGFEKPQHYINNIIPTLHKVLKKYNDIFIWFAGNHDNPAYFEHQLINTKYVKCIPSYTIINILNKNILNISGGISIDREYRKDTDSIKIVNYMKYHDCDFHTAVNNCTKCYWEEEPVQYKEKLEERIDIICSHVAPSFCFPTVNGSIIYEYAQYDKTLLADINRERAIMDNIYEDYKDTITHWYYGHYHKTQMEIINNTTFKLLDIGELCRHIISPDNYDIL